ncbi:MAG TPA: DegT/DnrJ/EryC1/StrS family aminotransferase, partial [Gaiellaceae bacterium]
DRILAERRAAAFRYHELLADVDGLELPCGDDDEHVRSWFVYVVTLPERVDRESVIGALEERGIQTARYLPCIHLQPYMRERYGFSEGLCPAAEGISARTLALPFHARIEAGDQEYVAEALRAALAL